MTTRLIFVGIGITAAATIQKGAFYLPTSLILPALMVVLAIASKPHLGDTLLLVVGAFATYWFIDAALRGNFTLAAPFLGGLIGFGACYALSSKLSTEDRARVVKGLVGVGMIVAISGWVGTILHLQPLALPSDGLWRLASTLTYANAAAYVLAMMIPFTVTAEDDRLMNLSTYACIAGLIATMSRGGLLAALVAAAFVAKPLIRQRMSAILFGILVGTVALALAGREGPQSLMAVALIFGAVGTVLIHRRRRLLLLVAAVGLIAAVAVGQSFLATAVKIRSGGASVEARFAEWTSAVHEFQAEPLLGTGPERALSITTSRGRQIARFAHNEYLQVLASSGLIGMALLLATVFLVMRRVIRVDDSVGRAAVASLLAFAVAGALDFSWHIPAITMIAGWSTGIAKRKKELSSWGPPLQSATLWILSCRQSLLH